MEASQGSEVDLDGEAPDLRDDQQVRLVQSLRAAGGAPVDFEDLRAMGIEHPAVLCYELEIAGVPIVQTRQSDRRMLALDTRASQLVHDDPADEEEEAAAAPPRRARSPARSSAVAFALRRSANGALAAVRSRRALAQRAGPSLAARLRAGVGELAARRPAAARARTALDSVQRRAAAVGTARNAHRAVTLAALAVAIVAIAAIASTLDNHGSRRASAAAPVRAGPSRAHSLRHAAPLARRPAVPSASQPITASNQVAGTAGAARVQISPEAASALGLEGHQLLADGRYTAAIGDLQASIRRSGQSADRCIEPATEACFTFAYSLYDLGRALRLSGHTSAAIPILSERLRIDNQRPVVQHELELARGPSA